MSVIFARRIPTVLAGCLLSSVLRAQTPYPSTPEAARAAAPLVATAIRDWVADYEHGRLGPQGLVRDDPGLRPAYARAASEAGILQKADANKLTHLDELGKLLYFAETHADEQLGDAVLSLAAIGFEKGLVDHGAWQLRDLGHWSFQRLDHQGCWFLCMRVAAGERLPALLAQRSEEVSGTARQVAAIKLLGQKARPVFRSTIEGALEHRDPRVRLAAAEAIGLQRRVESLRVLVHAMDGERHPVVSQALVQAVQGILQHHEGQLGEDERALAARAALHLFGQCGWRTDMDLVDLVAAFPSKEAVPVLIDTLQRTVQQPDRLLHVVNKNASPLLRDRTWRVLSAMTGAILPADQPQKWRQFWSEEGDRLVVPEHLPDRSGANGTKATFFGVPVTGKLVAFAIDTSGSMEHAVAYTVAGDGSHGDRQPSRLQAAKDQLLAAVQAMPPESRCRVLTFADEVRSWTERPLVPGPTTMRAVNELAGQLRPHGGTNLFGALVTALQLDQQRPGTVGGDDAIDELFLLTDGEPTVGDTVETEKILALVREGNRYRKVRIHCVFAGNGKGADLLRQLAAQNDGEFVQR